MGAMDVLGIVPPDAGYAVCADCATTDEYENGAAIFGSEENETVCDRCGEWIIEPTPFSDTLDAFGRAYVEAMLWSSTDDNGKPLDVTHNADDLAPEAQEAIRADCAAFQRECASAIRGLESAAGHDLWLTRNRHGAGFWDGDWPGLVGALLTEKARAMGEQSPYVGDDGLIYLG